MTRDSRDARGRARVELIAAAIDAVEDGAVAVAIVTAADEIQPVHQRADRLLELLRQNGEAFTTLSRWVGAQRGDQLQDSELRTPVDGGTLQARYIHGAPNGEDAVALTMLPPSEGAELTDFGLTRRQCEVLRLVWEGATNEQIAEALVISRHTVRHHLESIFRRLGVSSRAAAAHLAGTALASRAS